MRFARVIRGLGWSSRRAEAGDDLPDVRRVLRVGWPALVLLALWPTLAAAQSSTTIVPSPTPTTTRLMWDHDGLNVESWKLHLDATEEPITPTKEAAEAWSIPFPALTPGEHVLKVSACNIGGCGTSDPFAVKVVVIPAKPSALRVAVGGGS